jgi:hypothetical protein
MIERGTGNIEHRVPVARDFRGNRECRPALLAPDCHACPSFQSDLDCHRSLAYRPDPDCLVDREAPAVLAGPGTTVRVLRFVRVDPADRGFRENLVVPGRRVDRAFRVARNRRADPDPLVVPAIRGDPADLGFQVGRAVRLDTKCTSGRVPDMGTRGELVCHRGHVDPDDRVLKEET